MTGKLGLTGLAVTILYVFGIAAYKFDQLHELNTLPLNEFADFASGLFGPVALFWLILGYFQQGEELRNSVETLRMQARELALSAEQQRDLVRVSQEQLDHERSLARATEANRKSSIQPRFTITAAASIGFGDGKCKYNLAILNVRGDAIRLAVLAVYDSQIVGSKSVEYCRKGEKFDIKLFRDQPIERIFDNLEIRLTFRDEESTEGEVYFLATPPKGEADWGAPFEIKKIDLNYTDEQV